MFLASYRPHATSAVRPYRALDDLLQLATVGAQRPRLSAVNLEADDNRVTVRMQVPGIDPSSLHCSVLGDRLSISGTRIAVSGATTPGAAAAPAGTIGAATTPVVTPGADLIWHHRERQTDAFERSLRLPYAVESAQTQATLHDGVLTVTLPRREADRPRRIVVTAA